METPRNSRTLGVILSSSPADCQEILTFLEFHVAFCKGQGVNHGKGDKTPWPIVMKK